MTSRARIVVFGILLASACTPRREAPAAEPPPTVTLYGMKVTSFRGTELVAAGRAAKLTYVRNSTEFIGSEVLMRFPSQAKLGEPNSFITGGMEVRAPTVVGNQAARQAEGREGVVMRSGDGVVAKTERASFDGNSRTAHGDSRIDVDGPRYSLSADHFDLSFVTQEYQFNGNVQSRLGPKEDTAP
ncbi:MAG: hypothetical protein ACJ790_17720 [Myxococcaceae bacterium]